MKDFVIALVSPEDSRELTVLWEYDTLEEAHEDLDRISVLGPKNTLVVMEVIRYE